MPRGVGEHELLIAAVDLLILRVFSLVGILSLCTGLLIYHGAATGSDSVWCAVVAYVALLVWVGAISLTITIGVVIVLCRGYNPRPNHPAGAFLLFTLDT